MDETNRVLDFCVGGVLKLPTPALFLLSKWGVVSACVGEPQEKYSTLVLWTLVDRGFAARLSVRKSCRGSEGSWLLSMFFLFSRLLSQTVPWVVQ